MENLFLIIMVFVLWSAGEGGAMLAACLLIPNDPSPTSMGYTITKFLPGFFSSFSYTPRKTMYQKMISQDREASFSY